MERKIGETFEYEGKTFKVKEGENCGCHGCFFNKKCTLPVIKMVGECAAACREDNKGVVFVEVQGQTQKTKETKDRKIGETFEFEGHKLKVVDKDSYGCGGCFFLNRECSLIKDVIGFCSKEYRTDEKHVIFVEAKDEQPQKLNLCEILKHCPNGELLWSPLLGNVKLYDIDEEAKTVDVTTKDLTTWEINADGTITIDDVTSEEIMLYPSREQRDWTKVKYENKKEKFDPNTLSPFDRVLGRNHGSHKWTCDLFSDIIDGDECMYHCIGSYYRYCIPYNDDTKHLLDTKEEAPVFYRYWED